MFDECSEYIEDSFRNSTRIAFKLSPFWSKLPSTLKNKIVRETLRQQIETLKYFFNDYLEKFNAPEGFVTSIMASLDASRFEQGEIIVQKGEEMRDLIFIMKGTCDLYGTF